LSQIVADYLYKIFNVDYLKKWLQRKKQRKKLLKKRNNSIQSRLIAGLFFYQNLLSSKYMKIIIKTKDITLNKALQDFIYKKVGKLNKFVKPFEKSSTDKGKSPVEIEVEVGRTTKHHQKGDIFRAEGQMFVSGENVRAEAVSEDLKKSVVEMQKDLKRELKKYKNKMATKTKKRRRFLKSITRFSPLSKFKKK